MKDFIKKLKSHIIAERGASAVFALLLIGCVIATTSSLLLSASSVISTVKSEQSMTNYSSAVNSAIELFRSEVNNLNYNASYTEITKYDEENREIESRLSEEGFTDCLTGAGRFEAIISDMLSEIFNPEYTTATKSNPKDIKAVYIISLTRTQSTVCDVKLTLSLKSDYTLSAVFEAVDANGKALTSSVALDYLPVSPPEFYTNKSHYRNYIYESEGQNTADSVIGFVSVTEKDNNIKIHWNDPIVYRSTQKGADN